MSLTAEQRAAICAAARAYLGVPWMGQGRSIHGIDCTGLVECTFIDAGFQVTPAPPTYRGVDSRLLLGQLNRHFDKIPTTSALPGDVVLYGVPWAAHVGILVDSRGQPWPLNGIHCPINGKAVESRFDLKRGHVRGIYTWR